MGETAVEQPLNAGLRSRNQFAIPFSGTTGSEGPGFAHTDNPAPIDHYPRPEPAAANATSFTEAPSAQTPDFQIQPEEDAQAQTNLETARANTPESVAEKETQKSLIQQAKEAFAEAIKENGPLYFNAGNPEMDQIILKAATEKIPEDLQAPKEGETAEAFQARKKEGFDQLLEKEKNNRVEINHLNDKVKDAKDTGMIEETTVDTDGNLKKEMKNATPQIIEGLNVVNPNLAKQVDQARRVVDPATKTEMDEKKFTDMKLQENPNADPKAIKEEFDKRAIVFQKAAAIENKQLENAKAKTGKELTPAEQTAEHARALIQAAIKELTVLKNVPTDIIIDLNDAYITSFQKGDSREVSGLGLKAVHDALEKYNSWYAENKDKLHSQKDDPSQPRRLEELREHNESMLAHLKSIGADQIDIATVMTQGLFGEKIPESIRAELAKFKGLNWVDLKRAYANLLKDPKRDEISELISGQREPKDTNEAFITFLGKNHHLSDVEQWKTFNNPPIHEKRQREIARQIIGQTNPDLLNTPYAEQYIEHMQKLLFGKKKGFPFGLLIFGSQFAGLIQQLMGTGVDDEGGARGGGAAGQG